MRGGASARNQNETHDKETIILKIYKNKKGEEKSRELFAFEHSGLAYNLLIFTNEWIKTVNLFRNETILLL